VGLDQDGAGEAEQRGWVGKDADQSVRRLTSLLSRSRGLVDQIFSHRIAENIDVLDFQLTDDDLRRSTHSPPASAVGQSRRQSPCRRSAATSTKA